MKLSKHIAYKFLTDKDFPNAIVCSIAGIKGIQHWNEIQEKNDAELQSILVAADLLHVDGQKSYYLTESVIDKLDMLKVTRKGNELDWRVFIGKVPEGKKMTVIMPDNSLFRLRLKEGRITLFYMKADAHNYEADCFVSVIRMAGNEVKVVTDALTEEQVKERLLMLYRALCFIYLSENEYQVIQPRQRFGTRKQGKVINELPFPITTITSKWNVTSIRTEGFPVSGHFRLQPTREGHKMIFIEPFEKHGYIRRSKKDTIK